MKKLFSLVLVVGLCVVAALSCSSVAYGQIGGESCNPSTRHIRWKHFKAISDGSHYDKILLEGQWKTDSHHSLEFRLFGYYDSPSEKYDSSYYSVSDGYTSDWKDFPDTGELSVKRPVDSKGYWEMQFDVVCTEEPMVKQGTLTLLHPFPWSSSSPSSRVSGSTCEQKTVSVGVRVTFNVTYLCNTIKDGELKAYVEIAPDRFNFTKKYQLALDCLFVQEGEKGDCGASSFPYVYLYKSDAFSTNPNKWQVRLALYHSDTRICYSPNWTITAQ